MKYQKFTKQEKKEIRSQIRKNALAGEGLYVYQNSNANAELTLPRPTHTGKRIIRPNEVFQGDDYYMQLVKTGMLRLVEVLHVPQPEEEVLAEVTTEPQKSGETMNESVETNDKLILDQPDVITEQGPVEQVVDTPPGKIALNEGAPEEHEQVPVLLNEGPVDDGFVIVEN